MAERSRARSRSLNESLPPPGGLEARRFTIEGDDYVLLEFQLPGIELPEELSAAERDVARRTIEGQSKEEIARAQNIRSHGDESASVRLQEAPDFEPRGAHSCLSS